MRQENQLVVNARSKCSLRTMVLESFIRIAIVKSNVLNSYLKLENFAKLIFDVMVYLESLN
jgi:hypothetical protein